MNTGKTLFAQLMDFLPWTTFTRIVYRYGGDHRVRTLSCAEQYRSMAFAQLTYRESLRDIETCLSVHASKLYHMGFRQPVRRSTLADANERRDWRIHAVLAQRLITQARTLYVDEELGLGPDQYRLRPGLDDHRSVPVGLSVGALPHHQGGGEDAHAARPAGQHSEFYPRSRMASCTTFMPSICSCRKPEPSTSWIVATSTLPAFMCCTKPGPSSSRVPSRTSMLIASIRRRRIARPASFATRPWDSLDGFYTRQRLPRTSAAHPLQGPRVRQDAGLHHQQLLASGRQADLRALQKPLAGGTLLQVDQAASSDQAVLRHVGERGEDADLDCRLGLRPRRHRQEAPRPGRLATMDTLLQILSVTALRENAHTSSTCGRRKQMQRFANNQPIELVWSIFNRTLVIVIRSIQRPEPNRPGRHKPD